MAHHVAAKVLSVRDIYATQDDDDDEEEVA